MKHGNNGITMARRKGRKMSSGSMPNRGGGSGMGSGSMKRKKGKM